MQFDYCILCYVFDDDIVTGVRHVFDVVVRQVCLMMILSCDRCLITMSCDMCETGV